MANATTAPAPAPAPALAPAVPDQCEEHVQAFHPGAYAFWCGTMFALFALVLLVAAWGWYLRRCHADYAVPAKRTLGSSTSFARRCLTLAVKPVNSFAVVYFCVCRLVWLLDPHPNSVGAAGRHIYPRQENIGTGRSRPLPAFLITTPQTLVLLAYTLMISLWRRITNNALHVRRQAKSVKKETYTILAAVSVLLFAALPLGIASSVYPLTLSLVSNGIFALYMIVMCSLAFYYIAVLQNIVKKLKSEKTKMVVIRIERTVILSICACVLLVGGIAYDAVAISRCDLKTSSETNAQYLAYVWLVHLAEALGCMSIVHALWPTRKKNFKRKVTDELQQRSSVLVASSSFTDLEADRYDEGGSTTAYSSGEKEAGDSGAGEAATVELTQQYASSSSSGKDAAGDADGDGKEPA